MGLRLHTVDGRYNQATMGKYALAWLLGVPGIVLIAIYFLSH
jgi:hypothetical protein